MLKKPTLAAIIVTLYLVVYYILFQAGAPEDIILTMFALSPFLVIWMVMTILKYGKYEGPELKEDEEWGYQDWKPKK